MYGEIAELRSELLQFLTVERSGIDVENLVNLVIKEAADASNFAMMIADKARTKVVEFGFKVFENKVLIVKRGADPMDL
ncbi:hypothetical protein [Brevibacillus borstelensis]|uniref:hypothetical protein n=1 Tax=Brevibacillus borstelensis TaxID=45462 RepID=UPI0030BBDA3E